MMKTLTMRSLIVLCSLIVAVTAATMACAAEFYVIHDSSGTAVVVNSKPLDASVIIKGPFGTYAEAELFLKNLPVPPPPIPGAVPPPPPPLPVPPPR